MALTYDEIKAALRGEHLPLAFVDLDALDRNLDRHLDLIRGRGTPLRVATKSVRAVAVLRRLLERGGEALRGLMCYSVAEAAFLSVQGFDDFLVAYPPFQEADIETAARLTAEGKRIALTADSIEGLERISSVARRFGVKQQVLLCVDMSLKTLRGRLHLGVRRSPLHSKQQVLERARFAGGLPGVAFHGLLCYEAQIAGLQDANPFDVRLNPIKALVKRISIGEVRTRRSEIVAHLRANGLPPTIVNGGGTGSIDTTTPETGITEITTGSGFYKPHLFDYYRAPHMQQLEPAAFFVLEVTRKPTPDMVTCLGGGYVASGTPGYDKVPLPYLPQGLALTSDEAAGEVQTPLRVPPAVKLAIGDPVVFRHAKAGELAERFSTFAFVQGGRIVDRVPTYRGQGQCFL
jgi:D-serine deaminase-like pyridoxal phosphate-dependent protein